MEIVWCLPGKDFTGEFIDSFYETITQPYPLGIREGFITGMTYRRYYSSDIYGCRNQIVSLSETGELSRDKVFGGQNYDYMVWIDSDMQFRGSDILRLLAYDEDIVSAVCPLGQEQKTCFGKWRRSEDGRKTISYYTIRGAIEEERNEKGLIPVDFTGFGVIVVKKGVFEALGYPYFKTTVHDYEGSKLATSEDIGWCVRVKELGYQIYVDPEVRVGHKKEMLIRADEYERTV